ncbi:MAG: RluA family pseudouridine synthase [Oscillospiraceae bacterium]|nr:RluA family pseudouridine synthase [Oscillospiraceae bacterium]
MTEFTIKKNDSGQRVDKFISKALPDMPKSLIYKLIRKKDIKLNGKRCEISDVLRDGDILRVYAPADFSTKKTDMEFLKAPSDIEIIYEDENIIVVNKPAGLAAHSGNDRESDTLVNRIKHYLYLRGSYAPESEASFAPALCSRLDKNTCGLVTAAKNAAALREMNAGIRDGFVTKIYHCAAVGVPAEKNGILSAYHFKMSEGNIVKISDFPKNDYRPIKTGYKLLAQSDGLSLLEITLYTGRTHQIRAHLSHIGLPVLGDPKYGSSAANKRYGVQVQALCAYRLRFSFSKDSPLEYLNEISITAPKPGFERIFIEK